MDLHSVLGPGASWFCRPLCWALLFACSAQRIWRRKSDGVDGPALSKRLPPP